MVGAGGVGRIASAPSIEEAGADSSTSIIEFGIGEGTRLDVCLFFNIKVVVLFEL
jgi:hypothetical protein